MKMAIWIAIIVVIIAAALVYVYYPNITGSIIKNPTTEQACVNSGGAVRTSLCCKSSGDFPNLCLMGACGCSPDNSHEVKICDCGDGRCWDGSKNQCVPGP